MNWYARMIYPHTKGTASNGHYDLQLVGTYTFDEVTYTNPIFCYVRSGDMGSLAIFNRSLTTAIYRRYLPFKGYHYNDTNSSTTAEYKAFLNLIARSIKADSKNV